MDDVTLSETLYLVCSQRVAGKCGTLVELTGKEIASHESQVASESQSQGIKRGGAAENLEEAHCQLLIANNLTAQLS